MLHVKNLSQSFSGKQILHSIDFDASAGKIIAFLGPNGAGKTTILKSAIGLYSLPDSKQTSITLDDINLTHLPVHKRVELGLCYVPQQSSLFQALTLEDNLWLIYEHHGYWQGKSRDEFEQEVSTLLETITLTDKKQTLVRHLSGGQQRKAEVVRAILMHPRAVLFDEPFAGVDPKSIYELKKLFVDMAKSNIAVIISDHHVDQLVSIADKLYVVIGGTIVTSGPIEQVMKNKELKERYLGSQFHAEVAERFL